MSLKTALVFGCTGQDGSLICKSLLQKKYQVIGLSRKEKGLKSNLAKIGIERDILIEIGSITNMKTVSKLIERFKPNEIYNLAAQSSVGKSFYDPVDTIESIVNGTLNILEVSRKLNYDGNIFFAGSSEIFGNTETRADINYKQEPINPYAIGKQASLNLVKMYRDIYGIKAVTGILFNHESYLRDNKFITHKIISGAIKCSKDKSHRIEIGNINISRDWGWAEEYVEAIQLITKADKIKEQIICTGRLTSLEDFIEIVFKKLNLNWKDYININKNYFRKKDIAKSYGNPDQLEKDLNWKAKISVEESIERIIESKLKDS